MVAGSILINATNIYLFINLVEFVTHAIFTNEYFIAHVKIHSQLNEHVFKYSTTILLDSCKFNFSIPIKSKETNFWYQTRASTWKYR